MDINEERPRVLIVDDQKNWREALCDMLESDQYEIETAASYDEAKRKLRERAFHVLVSDQRLVDADDDNIQGIILLDELSELKDGAQAIIVTGYPTIEAVKKALRGRDAYDYLLKRPEEGGPFKLREYRDLVKGAAQKAVEARKKSITLGFSLPAIARGLTYEGIAKVLFSAEVTPNVVEGVRNVLNRLFFPFQPLARGMSRVWLSEEEGQICEFLCWSRNQGKAVLIRMGQEHKSLEIKWRRFTEKAQYVVKESGRHGANGIAGVSYVVDRMTFEDFAEQVEED